ncbi:MAG: rhodanese-like domain-containing protein [Deltaproteobacteria bacterium]|nr:rhodanese-like domain-containing protein [Deltaproteobacteria bacterium]
MKLQRLAVIIGMLFALCISLIQPVAAAGHKVITGPELEAMMKDGAPIVIVDVRESELYAEGHIPGAINIPYEDASQTRILRELSPKDRIVFICHGGPMGDELGGILARNNYANVYNVAGGMRKWKGPIVK